MQANIRTLVIILIILGGIIFWQQKREMLFPRKNPFSVKEVISEVTLIKNNTTLSFTKKDSSWFLDGKRADTAKVNNLLAVVRPTIMPEIVSANAANHKNFSLEATGTATLKIAGMTLYLGKSAPSGGVYARFDKENTVYVLPNVNAYDISATYSDWLDKTIISGPITKLTIGKTTFIKEKDTWKPENKTLDTLVQSLSPLLADRFPDENSRSTYPENPEITMIAGDTTVEFYPGPSDVLIIRKNDAQEFIINTTTANIFLDFAKNM